MNERRDPAGADRGGARAPQVAVRVAVEAPQHTGLDAPLDYWSDHPLPAGALVRVPLGRRTVTGIVWDGAPEGDLAVERVRPIAGVLEALPPLDPAWRALVAFAAHYYQRGIGELALSVLPPELRRLDEEQVARRVGRLLAPPAPPRGRGGLPSPAPVPRK